MHRTRRSLAAAGVLGATVAAGLGATFALGGTTNGTDSVRRALDGSKPKNVIFFLGDGMGTQEITEARYYRGVRNPLNVDRLPFTGFDTNWSVKPEGSVDYVPDSAATGTMWATGKKTIDDRDSQGPSDPAVPGDNAAYKTVLEYAQGEGKKVGDVSTADLTDATPAVLAAHISNRNCSGPDNMVATTSATPKCLQESKAAGGLGSIAEQEADHKIDVLLGGGLARFQQTITAGPDAGRTVIDSARGKGINVVTDAAGLASSTASAPVLGLFGPATGGNAPNMSLEWSGSVARAGAGANSDAAETCNETARPANEPSLTDMTKKALALLDNPKGFFLQVEGASIDKQDHAADACQQIGETVAFDNAIGAAIDYQRTHPDTLIVVTADHGHTSEIVPEDISSGSSLPTGYSNNLRTADGQNMRVTYGTSGYGGATSAPVSPPPSQQHTGTVVPVWAGGPQGANVLGTHDHTDLFDLLRGAKVAQAPASGTASAFSAQIAVAGSVTLSELRGRGLRVAVLPSAAATVSVKVTAGGASVAAGSGMASAAGSVTAKATKAGKALSRRTKATVTVTFDPAGPGTDKTVSRTVTLTP